jgi:hypothetical protein
MTEDGLPDFKDKIVALYVANAPPSISAGAVLEHASFKRLDGRLFVVGRAPAFVGSNWVSNLEAAVAWDSVVHYLIFQSREDYLSRMKVATPWWRRFFLSEAG